MTDHGAKLVEELRHRFVTVNDDVTVGGRTINVLRPRSAEELISEADFARDERLPYWAELWPSSTVLGRFLLSTAVPPSDVIELGCGIGLVSVAAALAGHRVLATDYYADALLFTRANTFRNVGEEVDTRLVDWRVLPEDLPRFDLVLASDVLYESRYADLVAGAVRRVLSPAGRAYVADPGRVAASAFIDACRSLDLDVGVASTSPYLAGKVRQTITVYEVRAGRPG